MAKVSIRQIPALFAGGLGMAELAKLKHYCKKADKTQKKLLLGLMKDNKTTVYGKANNFGDVKSVEDYQNIVPLSTYADYEDYVWRMANGEKGLITNRVIRRFTESSGSTGRSKLVPLSGRAEWICQCFGFSAPVGCAVKYFREQGRLLPPQRGLNTAEIGSRKLPGGKRVSCISSIPLLNLRPLIPLFNTTPAEVMYHNEPVDMDMHYAKLRFALQDRRVSYLTTIFITTLESMLFYLENNWEMLCDDIEKGTINENIKMPDGIRQKLLKKLKPNPKRADELRAEFRKGFDVSPIVPRIWPECEWIFGMGTGVLSLYEKKLRRYIGDKMAMHYLGYAATEALMAVPIEFNSFEYVILPQNGFFEFLPLDAPEGTKPLTISELEVGKEYELILTNTSGFYRYRIEDVVKVTGYYYGSPKITFCYRLNQIANISGEKINQMALDEIVDNFSNEIGELLIGYSIYADRSTSPGHYILFIETTGEHGKDEEEQLAKRFEEALCNGNVSVAPLIASGALGHCEVRLLRRGSYDEYRQMLKDGGANLNQIKPVKVIDTDKKKDFFFHHTI
ncbi:MAG: GH3 auxin-responsive promoter family protein [Acutalibacteraceae bacterium]